MVRQRADWSSKRLSVWWPEWAAGRHLLERSFPGPIVIISQDPINCGDCSSARRRQRKKLDRENVRKPPPRSITLPMVSNGSLTPSVGEGGATPREGVGKWDLLDG